MGITAEGLAALQRRQAEALSRHTGIPASAQARKPKVRRPKGERAERVPSRLEAMLLAQLEGVGLRPEREVRFHPARKWRLDFAFLAPKVAVEVEGGVWAQGRHTRGAGFSEDCVKRNAAQTLGWIVLSVTEEHITSGDALRWIADALKARGARAGVCREVPRVQARDEAQ